MKVPANLPADRLILEYLSRAAAAGNRQLPKGTRMAFVSTTRNRIWREIGPGGTADPDRVRDVLARLGEPEDLVMAERARLNAEAAERLERQAQKKEDAAAAAAAAAAASGTAPLQYRPRSPRPGPARPAGPQRRRPPDDRGDAGAPEGRPGRRGGPKEGKPRRRLGGLLADWQDRPGNRPPPAGGPATPGTRAGPPPRPGRPAPAGAGGRAAPPTSGAGGHAAGEGREGGGSDSARGQPANGVTPAGTGARQKGGTTPSGAGPPAEEEQSAFSRGTHALRGAAVTLGN